MAPALAGAAKIAAGGKGAVDAAANLALRRWLDIAMGSLLGIFYLVFPLIVIVMIMVFELLFQYVRPSWQLPLWRKITYIVTIFLTFFLVLIVVGSVLYIKEHPDDACVAFGGAWGYVSGKLGVCSVAGDLFSAILGGGGSFGGAGASGSW